MYGAPAHLCPFCNGTSHRAVLGGVRDRLAGRGCAFDIVACTACGLASTSPTPTPEALAQSNRALYSDGGAPWALGGQLARGTARHRLKVLLRKVRLGPESRLLDIGCSDGAFVAQARRATHCDATGVDMEPGILARAEDRDRIRYLTGPIEQLDLPAEGFEVVTLFQTLEHVQRPAEVLRSVHRLLAPGGHCVLEVPNFDSWWRRVFRSWWMPLLVPQHLVHFTPSTLRRVVQEAGFDVVQARGMFYPIESTVSLALRLNHLLGGPLHGYRLHWSRPDGVLLALFLAAWWLAVEVPSQALLAAIGRSGNQWLVARKPA